MYYWNNTTFSELQLFWVHLSNAKLIKGDYQVASGNIVVGEDPGAFFPKDALNKAYLIPALINGKVYIATGFTHSAAYHKAAFRKMVLSSAQAQYIHQQANRGVNINIQSTAELAFNTNDRMHPTAESWRSTGFSQASYYSTSTWLSIPGNRCVESDGSGGYKYNIDDGFCNLIWRLDY